MAGTPQSHGEPLTRTGARVRRLFRRDRFVTALTALVAVWVPVSARVLGESSSGPSFADAAAARWNAWLVGAVVLLAALLRWFRPLGRPWASVVIVPAGVWLAAATFVLDRGEAHADVLRLSDLAAGIVLALLGLRSLMLYRRAARTTRAMRG
ncbi:SPW repeat domain-containing protein [Streptomyces macrosporus]|uniref:SPW repeat-containing integral membrane domain-containing protein n=1 Tax=Streptomyces macrosporus TaxID=44032 RepID=A0ABN3KQZ3_9ACTN